MKLEWQQRGPQSVALRWVAVGTTREYLIYSRPTGVLLRAVRLDDRSEEFRQPIVGDVETAKAIAQGVEDDLCTRTEVDLGGAA